MIILGIAVLLFVILPLAAYLLKSVTMPPPIQRAVQRTTTMFKLNVPRRNGRSPLIVAAQRKTTTADDSSRITSTSFPAFH